MSELRNFKQYLQSLPEYQAGKESAEQMCMAPAPGSSPPPSAAPGPAQKAGKQAPAAKKKDDDGALHLQTALDSNVIISKSGAGYLIALDMATQCVDIGSYEVIAGDPDPRDLPIYVEDIVTADRALVRIKYDPARVKFTQHATNQRADANNSQALVIQVTTATAEELKVAAPPKAHKASGGYVAEGKENVTSHSGSSEIDRVMGSVASAEGGFASTEGSDAGIFTWGQGQWTVGANLLQPVLEFIKTERQDLFDRYFGAVDLDVRAKTLYWKGKAYSGKKALNELFHASDAQNKSFVDAFSRAGSDPQIQRLQREYQRKETSDKLHEAVGGHEPDQWLNTRGKAFYYSMWVNAPAYSSSFFKQAIAAKAAGAKAPTPALIEAVSQHLEDQFKQSSVVAFDAKKHHIIAFWGEGGRKRALDEADKHIADPSLDKTWTKEQWQKHREAMAKRESRYDKTKGDINTALNKKSVEPDVPADAQVSH